jgi:hypothetical protein
VVDFLGRHDLASFKLHTEQLNDLATYRQLTARAAQCGYRIGKVVYRGFDAPASLQQLLDQAIESRTRLQLERATQQQAQELEDFKLERQLVRADRQRSDGAAEQTHALALQKAREAAALAAETARAEAQRDQRRLDHERAIADQRTAPRRGGPPPRRAAEAGRRHDRVPDPAAGRPGDRGPRRAEGRAADAAPRLVAPRAVRRTLA